MQLKDSGLQLLTSSFRVKCGKLVASPRLGEVGVHIRARTLHSPSSMSLTRMLSI